MTPESTIRIAWTAWAVSWFAAAAWSARSVNRAGIARELTYRLVIAVGAVLLFGFYRPRSATALWLLPPLLAWATVPVAVFGLLFTWWARIYLGRLWSSGVARKEHHRIVDTGPYALVRHPIYSGVLLATIATAALSGRTTSLAGAVLVIAGLVLKARLEETFLREQLGTDAYDDYKRRVPMLVPFITSSS